MPTPPALAPPPKTNTSSPQPKLNLRPRKVPRPFDASRYTTRLIAIKFAYIGGPYGGYEYHGNDTALPTIEEVLYSALLKSRLVAPSPGHSNPESPEAWPGDDAVNYSKCGRTDRGVSAFGQVVGVRVRSARPFPKTTAAMEVDGDEGAAVAEKEWDDVADELAYAQILNRLLPPTIRVLAWSPNPPEGFSARFNCRARHYRYFFTNPMLSPMSGSSTLDIPAMEKAAGYYLGSHDFRNFCKLDASKQIGNFTRDILHASIERLQPSLNESDRVQTYYFDLRGSAFLWHQVRHMMAILFLVGQGLEKPEVVRDMLDMDLFPTKPMYEMADDRPLVLWDCVFPDDDMRWIPTIDDAETRSVLVDSTWQGWHMKKVDELLAGELVGLVENQVRKAKGLGTTVTGGMVHANPQTRGKRPVKESHVLILGSGEPVLRGKYFPIAERNRQRDVGESNANYFARRGDWRERREKKRKAEESGNE